MSSSGSSAAVRREVVENATRSPLGAIAPGVVTIPAYQQVVQDGPFRQMEEFSNSWLTNNRDVVSSYAKTWVADPLHQWSRQWEYPFVHAQVAAHHNGRLAPYRALDAGSGVTFFPYCLQSALPVQVACCDSNVGFAPLFAELNHNASQAVEFECGDLRGLPWPDSSFDCVYCISVLEHTEDYAAILKEFNRVLVPGGRFIMTFDICLDGQAAISPEGAESLLSAARDVFPGTADENMLSVLKSDELLTTKYVRRLNPALLPWQRPTLKNILAQLRWRRWPRRHFVDLAVCGAVFDKQ